MRARNKMRAPLELRAWYPRRRETGAMAVQGRVRRSGLARDDDTRTSAALPFAGKPAPAAASDVIRVGAGLPAMTTWATTKEKLPRMSLAADPYMAVRVLTYLGLLYQDLIHQKTVTAGQKLPPVLPIVLYNGKPRWGAATEIGQLIVSVRPAPFFPGE